MSGAWHFVCYIFILMLPVSLLAQETAGAFLRVASSGVSVNDSPVRNSRALFKNDAVQIHKGAAARIQSPGSAADIDGETVMKFADDELTIEHGSLSMHKSRGMRVRAGCLTVTPVNLSTETLYEVMDRDGILTVHATRGSVYISGRSKVQRESAKPSEAGRDLVREGERKAREDNCVADAEKGKIAGTGPVMNEGRVKVVGAAAIGIATCWVLGQDDDPISPHTPRRNHCPIPSPLP